METKGTPPVVGWGNAVGCPYPIPARPCHAHAPAARPRVRALGLENAPCCVLLLRLVSSPFVTLAATKADGFALYFLGECNNVSI